MTSIRIAGSRDGCHPRPKKQRSQRGFWVAAAIPPFGLRPHSGIATLLHFGLVPGKNKLVRLYLFLMPRCRFLLFDPVPESIIDPGRPARPTGPARIRQQAVPWFPEGPE